MKVKNIYEYDHLKDEIVGPHLRTEAVMGRGLFKYWKQLIYVNFDQNVTKCILDSLFLACQKLDIESLRVYVTLVGKSRTVKNAESTPVSGYTKMDDGLV